MLAVDRRPGVVQLPEEQSHFSIEHSEAGTGIVRPTGLRCTRDRLFEGLKPLADEEEDERNGQRPADENDAAEQKRKVVSRFRAAPDGTLSVPWKKPSATDVVVVLEIRLP